MPQIELEEEIDAIDAIYPDSVERLTPEIINFVIPNHEEVVVQLSFPSTYPHEKPNVIQVITKNIRKFPDNSYLEDKVNELIDGIFQEDEVVVFELFGELDNFLQAHDEAYQAELARTSAKSNTVHLSGGKTEKANKQQNLQNRVTAPIIDIDVTADWVQSDPIHDRGSTFIAYAKEVHSVEEARELFGTLITDRKIAKSAHNMNTWRIKGSNGVQYQDCDDDGETAAGLRMLHLLTVCIFRECDWIEEY